MTFWALVKYTTTGHVKRLEWPTPQARALEIVALGGYVQVLEEGHSA
jgi:hypothetical protein